MSARPARERAGPRAIRPALVLVLVLALLAGACSSRRDEGRAAASGAETRRSTPLALSLWVRGDSVKIRPGEDLGPPHPEGRAVRLRGARGETVAFQVAMAADAGSASVDASPSDLAGPRGTIPRRQLSVFLEAYLRCPAVEARVVALPAGEYPDPLLPLWEEGARGVAAPFPLPPRRNQVVWVDVAIPRDAAPGVYAGALSVRAADHPAAALRLEVSVDPFEIPARPSLAAWVPLYETRLWKREGLEALDPVARREVLDAYWRMAHEHRFVTQVAEQQPALRWDEATGALAAADWTGYDATYGRVLDGSLFEDDAPPRLWKAGGFVGWGAEPGETPHFGGDFRKDASLTPAHRRALGEYAREWVRHFRARGWTAPELFFYTIDEPDLAASPRLATLVKDLGDALHAAGTGVRHFVTVAPQASPLLAGAVDTWAAWGAGYWPRRMAGRQAKGERAFFYQQHEPFVGGHGLDHEGLGLRTWGWIARRYRVDGVFLWVGNFWNEDPYREPRNWDDHLLGNGVLFYPGALLPTVGRPAVRGPVSSFRMKALRRGLLDYEYFALLEARGGDPDAVVRRIVRSALNEGEHEPHWRHPLWSKPGDWSHEPADWDAARDALAREIVEGGRP